MRALVVDDSVSMRRLLAELLGELGYLVTAAGSGEKALELHAAERFDLMLVDWTLPGISGLDVCRSVRRQPGGEDVVLVVITGRAQPEDLHTVLDAGASDYLAKPIDPELLRTRLLVAARQAEEARQRRRGKQALLRSEEAFQRLVESAPDAVFATTRRGDVVYANQRMLDYLGYGSAEELKTKTGFSLTHPDDRTIVAEMTAQLMVSGEPAPPTELRFLRGDEGIVTGEVVAIPLHFDGRPSHLWMIRDLTERTEMQAQLVLADRMASVGTLAAGVAHELNNPLAYVLSNLALTREELEKEPDEEGVELIRQQIDEAIHGARRMGDIVRDLKTFSRGHDELESSVDVTDVLVSSINMCWNEIRHRACLEKDFAEVPAVKVNESRLGQVFLNLLINAAQAMPEEPSAGNRIHVRVGQTNDGWVEVVVEDTGRGIPAEHMSRIFDPFFTTKQDGEGTGLGLAICRNIVTNAGGQIQVQSKVGEGTSFVVRLPAASGQPRRVVRSMAPKPEGTGARAKVLVVDDEHLVGRSIRRALRGHDVEVLSSGEEAIQRLCDGNAPEHDIVFCDLMMPEVSGMDVFETVNAQRPDIGRRFVFMTGGAFTPRARSFLENTPNECLEKPFDLRRIRSLVTESAGSG